MTKRGAPRTEADRAGQRRRRKQERDILTFADLEAMAIPEPNSGCLLWLGRVVETGYGRTRHGSPAHTIAYEKVIGPIPDGLEPDHLCRVRCCINPFHMEPVTHHENLRRAGILARVGDLNTAKTHCPRGHPYDGYNLAFTTIGGRRCRACARERASGIRAQQREARI